MGGLAQVPSWEAGRGPLLHEQGCGVVWAQEAGRFSRWVWALPPGGWAGELAWLLVCKEWMLTSPPPLQAVFTWVSAEDSCPAVCP